MTDLIEKVNDDCEEDSRLAQDDVSKVKPKPIPKKIVFCLPGRSFSNNFLICWSNLINYCNIMGHKIIISNSYSPNIYYVRNECLGANMLDGILQKPFGGKVEYDYMFWLDSDIVFNVEHVQALINMDVDISCGCYIMSDNKNYAIVEKMNNKYLRENGSYQFMTRDDLEKKTENFQVDYTGFGFICIKKGVMESLQYPFFKPRMHEFNFNETIVRDYSSEDVSWCLDIKDQGYQIVCNPTIKVGHEKKVVLG